MEECGDYDYDCAGACGPAFLEGESLTSFEALLSCLEASECSLSDESCMEGSCLTELEAFLDACEV